ncbi:MAG: PASTA domain-containing protein, partial [Gammaproteobacteria bacterium]|nr:PASTA domain-containing protein [Gammaproteobacteria bacterium]
NATLAVGDVDNDGDIEIVGSDFISTGLANELWLLNADDCTSQAVPNVSEMIAAGGFSQGSHHGLLDIDGDGDLEIIGTRSVIPGVGGDGDHLLAIHHDGSLVQEWPGDGFSVGVSETIALDNMIGNSSAGGFSQMGPTFADIDADGTVEIIMPWYSAGLGGGTIRGGMTAFNAEDGTIAWEFLTGNLQFGDSDYKPPLIADIDLDGTMEIIYHNYVMDHTGELEFLLPVDPSPLSTPSHLATAVANFDDDPFAEIIAIDTANHYLFNHDGSLIFQIPRNNNSGSQIAVADFDGDREVEYAWYNGLGSTLSLGYFEVYDTDGSVLWSHQGLRQYGEELTRFKGVNPTAFDANNDGAFDLVVYLDVFDGPFDDDGVYIFDGRDGSVLEFMPILSASNEQRFTTIADVDNDGEAEVISSFTNGLAFATRIWEGATSHPLPAAPAYRNQWIFQEAYVNDDLTFPSNPIPHWLQPGLNGYNLIKLPPDPLAGTTDSFTYLANDGALDSNVATVTFDVQPPGNAPVFLSQPDTLTTVGFPYEYDPFVVDVDPGDSISFTLAAAPVGMTMSLNGTLNWLPDAEGEFPVSIIASDTIGFATVQSFTLLVGQPVTVPDVVGLPQASAETTLTGANLLTGNVQTATHPTIPAGSVSSQTPIAGAVIEFGGAVDLIVSLGPAPEDIDDDNDGFTENQGDCDDDNNAIAPGQPDAAGDGIDSDCDGIDGNLVLTEIIVSPPAATILTSETISLTATGIFEDGTSQNLTGVVNWSAGPAFSSATPGSFTVTASRSARAGGKVGASRFAPIFRGLIRGPRGGAIVGSAFIDVIDRVAGDAIPPIAVITAPENNSTVTAPTDITGSASDANFLKYELAYALAGDTNYTTIATSTTPVSNGVLGQFDPTLLINDLYTIRLAVFDTGGNQTIATTMVQIDENLKIGNYTLTFTDLQIPMAGIPITVTRTYDSRDKRTGDFGVGWRLGVQSMRIRANRIPGTGWEVIGGGFSFGLVPTDEHIVSITLPTGRVEEFDLRVTPEVSALVPFPVSSLRASFVPRFGTRGELVSLDNNNLSIIEPQPGVVTLSDDLTNNTYDPRLFRYTSADGTEIVISIDDGVQSVSDPSGNTLQFLDTGIIHSAGKSVLFTRDDLGRISELTDPRGNTQQYQYDGNGDLRAQTDAEGNVTTFKYDLRHNLIEAMDPLGNRAVRNEYDDDGRLTAIVDAAGNRVEFQRDIAGREEIQIDQRGNTIRYIFDDNGNFLSRERVVTIEGVPTIALQLYEYDARGNEIVQIDPDGVRTEITYDDDDNVLQRVVDPTGLAITTSSTYGDNGNVLSRTDANGAVTTYTYDGDLRPLTITDPLGNMKRFFYDSGGLLVATEDATGTVAQRSYSSFGQVTSESIVDAGGTLVSRVDIDYDANGNETSRAAFRYVDGVLTPFTTTFAYDGMDRRTTTTDPLGSVTITEIDGLGRRAADIDALGRRTEYGFNILGQQTTVTYADGAEQTVAFDPAGNVINETDALGRVTTFVYDEVGRRVTTIRPDGTQIAEVFSPGGRLAASIDARGARTEFIYDSAGRQVQTVLPQVVDARDGTLVNPVITSVLSPTGQSLSTSDANGNQTSFDYDDAGRLLETTFADGVTRLQTPDEIGRPASQTDEQGGVTGFAYDVAGRLLRVEQPSPDGIAPSPVTTYTYDLDGNRLTQTDALGATTRFEYDAAGRRTAKILPSGLVESTAYDAVGNVESRTDFNGEIALFDYDVRNRVIQADYADGSVASYTYNLSGTRATANDPAGTITSDYDAMDRVISEARPDGRVLTYTYDDNGNQASATSPTQSVSYTYDSIDRLSSVTEPGGLTTYGYDPVGNQVEIVRPNGATTVTTFDNRNRILAISHEDDGGALLESYAYTRTAKGQRETATESDGAVETYTYDAVNRLTRETRTGSRPRDISYSYDAVGNRIAMDDGSVVTYGYDIDGRLLNAGTTLFNYDSNGNRTARIDGATTVYDWDARNRLTALNSPSVATVFTYDVDDNRIERDGVTGGSQYLIDARSVTTFPQVSEERDAGDNLVAAFVYGSDLISRTDGGRSYYHTDAHGNTELLTNATGSVTDTYGYETYGELASSSGSSFNEHLYTGEQFDSDSGFYYLRARYYDPATGVFLSRDPIEGLLASPFTLQPYLYVVNDPVNGIDPSGQFGYADVSAALSNIGTLARVVVPNVRRAFCTAGGIIRSAEAAGAAGQIYFSLLSGIFQTGIETRLQGKSIFYKTTIPLPEDRAVGIEIFSDFKENIARGYKFEIAKETVTGDANKGAIEFLQRTDGKNAVRGSFVTEIGLRLYTIRACGIAPIGALGIGAEVGGNATGTGGSSNLEFKGDIKGFVKIEAGFLDGNAKIEFKQEFFP